MTSATQRKTTTHYVGVRWSRKRESWEAVLGNRVLGRYETAGEAAKAYDFEARRVFGRYARTNFGTRTF